MKSWTRRSVLLTTVLALTACGSFFPTEQEITDSLQEKLNSVNGNWTGFTAGPNVITLAFTLTQGSNNSVSGSGTMKEANAAASVPITVTGTFVKPTLTLTFNGMRYENTNVQGAFQGNYTSVGGISSSLQLTATGYSKNLATLIQEQ